MQEPEDRFIQGHEWAEARDEGAQARVFYRVDQDLVRAYRIDRPRHGPVRVTLHYSLFRRKTLTGPEARAVLARIDQGRVDADRGKTDPRGAVWRRIEPRVGWREKLLEKVSALVSRVFGR